MSNSSKGILLALATAFISGVSVFVNKFAVGSIASPLVFTSTKNLMVGFLILLFLLVSGKWNGIFQVQKPDRKKLILIGLVGGSLPFYLFFTGLAQTPAINAALIHKTLVIWVAILAAPFLKEKLTKAQGLAVLLLFSGNLLVGGFKGLHFSKGELMVLSATLLWSLETIIAKKVLARVDPGTVTLARMGLGSLVLVAASLIYVPGAVTQVAGLEGSQWFWILLTSAFLLGYVTTWYRALKHAPAVMVSAVLVVSPLITNVLSAIFITHAWNFILIPQTWLMITGLVIYWLSVKGRELITS